MTKNDTKKELPKIQKHKEDDHTIDSQRETNSEISV